MELFPKLDEPHRRLLLEVAERVEIPAGKHLMRRGDPGGDVYLVADGSFEVVDSRGNQEIILTTLGDGAMIGELAFVDSSPRSADVRAVGPGAVLRWGRDDLQRILSRNQDFAAIFFEHVAQIAASRLRRLHDDALSGTLLGREVGTIAGIERARVEVRALAEKVKGALVDLETRLRLDPNDPGLRTRCNALLDRFQEDMSEAFAAWAEPELADAAAEILERELNAYLVRSALAERCLRGHGHAGSPEVLAHILVNTANGDGQLGEIIDRWLLDRPTLAAQRAYRARLVDEIVAGLPTHRNRRVTLINAGTGSIVAKLLPAVERAPTIVTVVDESRDAFSFLDLVPRPKTVELKTVQEDLVELALGRARHALPPQDVIVVHGLLEALPDRLAVSLLRACAGWLAPEGSVVAVALAPSADQVLVDRLLHWPTIRRTPAAFERLFVAAGLTVTRRPALDAPALALVGGSAAGGVGAP